MAIDDPRCPACGGPRYLNWDRDAQCLMCGLTEYREPPVPPPPVKFKHYVKRARPRRVR